MVSAFIRKLLNPKWFEYMTYAQVFISTVVGLALVSTLDAKFKPYDNETVPLFDASQNQIGTFTFSGAFIWIHWNVFAAAWAFLTVTGLYIYGFFRKHWHGYHSLVVFFLNWVFVLVGFALIAANLYRNEFCNSLGTQVKWTMCLMPKFVLASQISLWVLLGIVIGYEVYLLRRKSNIGVREETGESGEPVKLGTNA